MATNTVPAAAGASIPHRPSGVFIAAHHAERASAVLALLQWVESARQIVDGVGFIAEGDPVWKDRLADDGLMPWSLEWTAEVSGCVLELMQDVESTMLSAIRSSQETPAQTGAVDQQQTGAQHG